MSERRIHLGIDYGTSSSKVVFRDYGAPGEERAFVLVREGSFRVPSSVGVSGGNFIFGVDSTVPVAVHAPRRWYESVKMRVAGEVTGDMRRYFYGVPNALPEGYSAVDLAALSVWFLVSIGHKAALEYLGGRASAPGIGMTMGIPMSFFRNNQLRGTFLEIVRVAWAMYRAKGPMESDRITINAASELLKEAKKQVADWGQVQDEEIRYWLRSEAEAAMWWPFRSPAIPAGPYAKVDIGAGTTNASLFRIVESRRGRHRVRDRLAFFGADSHPVGMDALDQVLARREKLADEQSLALRGQEDRLLRQRGTSPEVRMIFESINEAYRRAWILAYQKIRGAAAELDRFGSHGIFLLGGGSLVRAVREALRRHPGRGTRLETPLLERPSDLVMANGGKVPEKYFPFVAVAYGLSYLALDIPEVDTPDEIAPLPESNAGRERLDRDDLYAK